MCQYTGHILYVYASDVADSILGVCAHGGKTGLMMLPFSVPDVAYMTLNSVKDSGKIVDCLMAHGRLG